RSVGSSNPYLTLFSRAGLDRENVDAAVAKLEIHELPSARGCAYVLPASDFALALTVGQGFGGEMKVAERLGVTHKEIDRLCDSIIRALENGPLDPDGLREATGKAVRNLGPEGQKKGLTTTLPVALGKLQSSGVIRRIPTNGRLDQQRYKYSLWRPNPSLCRKHTLQGITLTKEETHKYFPRPFFAGRGPTTLPDFKKFAGLGVKATKSAVEPLKLEPLAPGDDHLLLPGDREELEA